MTGFGTARQGPVAPRRSLRRVVLCSALLLLLAAAGGALWEAWAEPGRWEVTQQGTILTQQAAQGQFGVELRFVAVGTVLCFLWALVAGTWSREIGWWLAPLFAVVTGAAAVVAWQVGALLGPPDPSTVTGVSPGDTFPDELPTPSVAAFLVWACAALGGLVLGLVASADRPTPQSPEAD